MPFWPNWLLSRSRSSLPATNLVSLRLDDIAVAEDAVVVVVDAISVNAFCFPSRPTLSFVAPVSAVVVVAMEMGDTNTRVPDGAVLFEVEVVDVAIVIVVVAVDEDEPAPLLGPPTRSGVVFAAEAALEPRVFETTAFLHEDDDDIEDDDDDEDDDVVNVAAEGVGDMERVTPDGGSAAPAVTTGCCGICCCCD